MNIRFIAVSISFLSLFAACDKKSPPAPHVEPPQLSDAARKDLQDIFIAGDRLVSLGGDVVQSRKDLEHDIKVFNIRINANSGLLKQGIRPPKDMSADADTALAKCEAGRKRFGDSIYRYVEVQVTAKTKIDFLNTPGKPTIPSAMQEASRAWATFRTTAEKNVK